MKKSRELLNKVGCVMKKLTILIILVVIVSSLFANHIDTANVSTGHEPELCIKFEDEKGGKVTYIGFGYKVVRYVKNNIREPYKENIGVKKGSWFMKFEKPENKNIDLNKLTVKDFLELLPQKQFETITNPNNPKTEELVLETEPSVYRFNKNTRLAGRKVIKYTYNTTQDGLLGPITFYVDKETGVVLASDYRE